MALGTEVPVIFCNDDEVAAKLHTLSGGVFDQVNLRRWPFSQLYPPTTKLIKHSDKKGATEPAPYILSVASPTPGRLVLWP